MCRCHFRSMFLIGCRDLQCTLLPETHAVLPLQISDKPDSLERTFYSPAHQKAAAQVTLIDCCWMWPDVWLSLTAPATCGQLTQGMHTTPLKHALRQWPEMLLHSAGLQCMKQCRHGDWRRCASCLTNQLQHLTRSSVPKRALQACRSVLPSMQSLICTFKCAAQRPTAAPCLRTGRRV